MHAVPQNLATLTPSQSRPQGLQQRPQVQPGTTNLTSNSTHRQRTCHAQCHAKLHAASTSHGLQGFRQSPDAVACVPACVPALQHSCWSSSPLNSHSSGGSSSSNRSARVRAHVFDKIRDMLSGNTPGWAGPPEGEPQAAAHDEGSDMVRIDAESSGGLGGTTEEVFGPLVSHHAHRWLG
jgi:hypothetical protein